MSLSDRQLNVSTATIVAITLLVVTTFGFVTLDKIGSNPVQIITEPGKTAVVPAPKSRTIEFGGETYEAPEGYGVEIVIEDIEGAESFTQNDVSKGKGSDISAQANDEMLGEVNTSAPEVGLTGVSKASGGSTDFSVELFNGKSGEGILYILGALLVVGGIIFMGVTKRIGLGGTIAGSGVALLGIAYVSAAYPWVWLLGLVGLVGVGVWFLYDAKAKEKLEKTAKSVVGGLERAKESLRENLRKAGVAEADLDTVVAAAQKSVKDSVKRQSESTGDVNVVKKEINKIKEKNGFGA